MSSTLWVPSLVDEYATLVDKEGVLPQVHNMSFPSFRLVVKGKHECNASDTCSSPNIIACRQHTSAWVWEFFSVVIVMHLRCCVNLAFWLPLSAGTSFMQPLWDKYAPPSKVLWEGKFNHKYIYLKKTSWERQQLQHSPVAQKTSFLCGGTR